MSLLGNIVSGAVGASLATVARDLIEKEGGVQGIAQKLQSSGLGSQVQSWIGTGKNLPVNAQQIEQALGNNPTIAALASKLGVSQQEIHEQLAKYLPQAVDEATPNGKIETPAAA